MDSNGRLAFVILLIVGVSSGETFEKARKFSSGETLEKGSKKVEKAGTPLDGEDELSPCLRLCIDPLTKMERSFTYVFNNYEKLCDSLERGAECVRKCGNEDSVRYHQYTSFYRLYCVDFQEGIEEHLSCLAKASQGSDKECKRRCHTKYEKTSEKEKKMKHACSSIECTTVCYYQVLSQECPNAQPILLDVNLAQITQLNAALDPRRRDHMADECHHLYDREYMRRMLLDRR